MLIFQKLNSSFANLMGTILLLLLTLTILGDYLYKKWKYWEVESWPSVPAHDLRHSSNYVEGPSGFSRSGDFTTSGAAINKLTYHYQVNEVTYRGSMRTPEKNDVILVISFDESEARKEELRAFYKPNDPSVAVLSPVPFEGDYHLIVILFAGPLSIICFYCQMKSGGFRVLANNC
ncbi:hypothetical protein N9940_00350 [bacterium]|nr:hypothetical protein [Akkermansiaceae bacterium]MDB4290349.1 hypothetical protein [bacterium]MDA7674894.1 hypothetical protein [Akkermansiaceae bacterium]MDB0057240.1 hypothetical protein [Akkermansiaceae bacterium]MDB4262358.1 hypothetical protein [Akkermansiaceae bacterium]